LNFKFLFNSENRQVPMAHPVCTLCETKRG